jgi:rhamnulokinase
MLADVFHRKLSGSRSPSGRLCRQAACMTWPRIQWAFDLIEKLQIPAPFFPEVVRPGTQLGRVIGDVATGAFNTEVIMPAAHDTASAVASIPGVDQKLSLHFFWHMVVSGCNHTHTCDKC